MGELFGIGGSLLAKVGEAASAEHGGSHEAAHEASHHVGFLGTAIYLALVIAVLFGLMAWAKQGLRERVFKNPITQAFEQLYLFIENMCVGIIGSHGRRYIPMIMTFWMVIFVSNLFAVFFGFGPTANLSFNLGMALISVGYVQWEGMRSNGVFGHLRHFAGPKMAGPLVLISAMLFVIELVSELMKNVSLSLRLYGNMHGGHQAVEAMNELGLPIFIPFGEFLLPIKLLTCLVQALIFSLLTCVYISLVTHHEEDHGEEHAGEHGHAPAHGELAAAH